MMPRRSRYWGLLGFALIFAGVCERSGSSGPPKLPANAPNVLLITLDTTRADHLGCYGWSKAQTPVLDALAASGVRFEWAFAQVPLTLPSHATLLTGTYPPSNGLRFNASGVLSDAVPTLAESFKAHGYRTGAFVAAGVLDSAFGLNRGFDCYDDKFGDADDPSLVRQERPADAVCNAALAWLGRSPEKPFFAWVHFFDPHAPYEPPPPFREKLADPYDGEIAFVDSQIRRLLDWLDANHCRDRTLIVAVGDHGEAFGEHGEPCHGLFLYDTTMQVPLILSFPAHLTPGKVIACGVRMIDVTPTVLDLMKWESWPELQGESLLPLLTEASPAFRPSYGETEYPRASFGWAPLRSYTTQQWMYIEAPQAELYDRAADPGESTNLVTARPDVAEQMRRELKELSEGMTRRDARNVTLDDRAIRALSSLGYVGANGAPAEADDGRPRRDPKDMISAYRRMSGVNDLFVHRQWPEVVQVLKPLLDETPESDELHAMLGEAYLQLHQFKEAEQEYAASLRTVPDSAQKWCKLGDALYFQAKITEAITCYQQSLSVSDAYVLSHNRLGVIYLQRQSLDEAYRHLRRCMDLDSASVNARVPYAEVLSQMGRHEEAVKLLQETLRDTPKSAAAYQTLGRALVAAHRGAEAVDALRAACRALPNDLSLKSALAGLLLRATGLRAPEAKEALNLARECSEADPDSPDHADLLASALAASGDLDNAIAAAARALSLAQSQGKAELATHIEAHLQALRARRPN
ncbi:MAG TPA: sulfatase-like hydrolase/transferase [Phycisphaerae bacterium]|nr:sulfatase-like hydrolase/transferase [Phycisphaerae bacterium]